MARVKLTEHQAKSLLFKEMNLPYNGLHITSQDASFIKSLKKGKKYVVKVDQGVKKRMKKGLVLLNVEKESSLSAIQKLNMKGYDHFIIEEMVPHKEESESYIAVERTREGLVFSYSKVGGIEVEEHAEEIQKDVLSLDYLDNKKEKKHYMEIMEKVAQKLGVDVKIIDGIREFCEKYYVSFLEINPLVVENDTVHILDLAIEVDSTAQFFVKNAWEEEDVVGEQHTSEEEQQVAALNKKSQAAFSLSLLNPNGSLWVLLSGGGASVTLADEVYNLGFGKELGNYGEYSGNPNAEETYLYTKSVLALMMKSNKRRLMLIIGGGVANFTDIRITFKGIIKALEEEKKNLKKKQIKIFVRRGGPFQENGLAMMEEWTKQNGMCGAVESPALPLHEIIRMAIKELGKK